MDFAWFCVRWVNVVWMVGIYWDLDVWNHGVEVEMRVLWRWKRPLKRRLGSGGGPFVVWESCRKMFGVFDVVSVLGDEYLATTCT